MRTDLRIYTCTDGYPLRAIPASLTDPDDGDDPKVISISLGSAEYKAYTKKPLSGRQVLVFDGRIPQHGLPRGAQSLDYEFSRRGDKHGILSTEFVRMTAQTGQVARTTRTEISSFALEELRSGVTSVMVPRQIIVLPIGSTALLTRLRQRNLRQQHLAVTAHPWGLTFRSIVK